MGFTILDKNGRERGSLSFSSEADMKTSKMEMDAALARAANEL